jgi:hypothetical protein
MIRRKIPHPLPRRNPTKIPTHPRLTVRVLSFFVLHEKGRRNARRKKKQEERRGQKKEERRRKRNGEKLGVHRPASLRMTET